MESLGDDEGDFIPAETFGELFKLAGEFIELSQKNLKEDNSNASGSLSNSFSISDPTQSGSVVSIDITMNLYGEFINSGVRGTKSGSGKYAFKSSFPSREMVKALQKGINRAKKSTTNVSRTKSVSKNEIKNVKISDVAKAYGAGRNIKMYGIKATGFVDKSIATTEKR